MVKGLSPGWTWGRMYPTMDIVYCCTDMREQLTHAHGHVGYHPQRGGYVLPAGPNGFLVIVHCPWCGTKLSKMNPPVIEDMDELRADNPDDIDPDGKFQAALDELRPKEPKDKPPGEAKSIAELPGFFLGALNAYAMIILGFAVAYDSGVLDGQRPDQVAWPFTVFAVSLVITLAAVGTGWGYIEAYRRVNGL